MSYYFRVDSNENIGIGHMMRCLSIARAMRQMGQEATFFVADKKSAAIAAQNGFGYYCLNTDYDHLDVEADKFIQIIRDRGAENLLVDSYFVTENYLNKIREVTNLTYIDDINRFIYPCNLLINYNIYADSLDYEKRYRAAGLDTEFALGLSYMPLREEFRDLAEVRGKRLAERKASCEGMGEQLAEVRDEDHSGALKRLAGDRDEDQSGALNRPAGDRDEDQSGTLNRPAGEPTQEGPTQGKPVQEELTQGELAQGKPVQEELTQEGPAQGKPVQEELTQEEPAQEIYSRPDSVHVMLTTGATDRFNALGKILEKTAQHGLIVDDPAVGAEAARNSMRKRTAQDSRHSRFEFAVIVGQYNNHRGELEARFGKYPQVHLLESQPTLADLIAESDIAVTAGGTTVYELCAGGIPSVMLTIADNQMRAAKEFSARGIIPYAGDVREDIDEVAERVVSQIEAYAADPSLQEAASERMRTVVDGRGAERLAKLLISRMK